MMRKIGLLAALAAGTLLGACGGNYYGGGDVGYVGPVALDDCGGYYDDFYGPLDNGCWADDGAFWYRTQGGDGAWHRDAGGHFAHAQASPQHHEVHPTGPGHGFHFGGGAHGGGGGDHHG